jgi:hypothetical protein
MMTTIVSACNLFKTRLAFLGFAIAAGCVVPGPDLLHAGTIFVPNGSFELPGNDFASPEMGSWEKAPQPAWYVDPTGMFPWEALMGQFLNTKNGSADHIGNLDGSQAAYLFASPDVAIFQDYNTISDSGATTSHRFNAQYEAGKSYALTVGVLGGGGGMTNGATLDIVLYFRDASNNVVTVGATTITNSKALFPTNTYFTDFQVRLPLVKATDAWAGKRIGIRIASTVGFDRMGGYWDLDNVRLTDSGVPNDSFESPGTDFAAPGMNSWEKAAEPAWYVDPTGMFPWEALMGQFLNTTNGSPDHITNMEGSQAAYLFASPDVAIFQDYNSIGGTNTNPEQEFNATFEPGRAYAVTVGVLGGGGGMTNGATLELSLYYRDAASKKVTVAATTVTNSLALFPTNTYFTDFQANVPPVRTNDAWSGKHIGIQMASTVGFDKMGGYWDVDNVRLTESVLANSSFESPETDFAAPPMDGWQKAPQPAWYQDPTGMFPWEALMGQFLNTTNGSADHIDNADGKQAAYLFASPDVAILQEANSIGDGDTVFQPGRSYTLTVGVIGGGGGMTNGATLEMSFYYRDAASNKVTVAAATITNTSSLFPTNTHLTDFAVQVPTVKFGDAWAGKLMGVQLASTVGFDKMGGYWDLDNVRLRSLEDPVLKNSRFAGGQFSFDLHSAGGQYAVLASTNAALPSIQWSILGNVTNFTGELSVTDTNTGLGLRFYQVRPAP